MYEVPKQSYQLGSPVGVSTDLFALSFFVVEVLNCFEMWGNDNSTSLNSEKRLSKPVRTKLHNYTNPLPNIHILF
jgi:hypothetical protein